MCGQHALNGLLQGSYFGPADLASVASQLDEMENLQLDPTQSRTESVNMDDSGYFSISCLDLCGLSSPSSFLLPCLSNADSALRVGYSSSLGSLAWNKMEGRGNEGRMGKARVCLLLSFLPFLFLFPPSPFLFASATG